MPHKFINRSQEVTSQYTEKLAKKDMDIGYYTTINLAEKVGALETGLGFESHF